MTVGKGCQIGNKMFLSHPVLCPVVICRVFEVVGSCSSEITLSCLLSAISHETENFCSGCFISPSAHPLPYLMRLMSCHPICHPNTTFQKTAPESLWCKCNLLMCFSFPSDIWDCWLFLWIVCTQSHWNALFSGGRGSGRVHNCLRGIHAPKWVPGKSLCQKEVLGIWVVFFIAVYLQGLLPIS